MTGIQNNLGGSVPSGYYILCKGGRCLLIASCKTKITNLQSAVFVEEKVRRFEISVDDVARVHVIASSQHLEHEILQMVIGQVLARIYHSVHISLHKFSYDIDIFVVSLGRGLGNIKKLDDVLMVKELQQLDLSHDSLSINQVFKSLWNLLDSNLDLVVVIIGTADDSIGSMTNLFNVFKFIFNAEGSA